MSSASNNAWASPRLSDHDIEEIGQASNISNEVIPHRHSPSKIKRLHHPTDSFFLVRLFQVIVSFALNSTLFVLVVCFSITILPLVLFIRRVFETCCTKTNGSGHGKLSLMNPFDGLWLKNSVDRSSISNIFFLLEGPISLEDVRELVNDKWLEYCDVNKRHRFVKLRMSPFKVCSGFAWMKNRNFHTEDFVGISNEQGAEIGAIEMMGKSSLIDEVNSNDSKKLWQVKVFPEFLDSQDTGILFQMHRSITDIFPFARFVFESLGYKTVYLKERCFPMHRLCLYFCSAFAGPLIIIKRLFQRKAKSILDKNNGADVWHKVVWSDEIDMKNIKKIKDISRTKVNIILMSCLSGALRSYFYMLGTDCPSDLKTCVQIDTRPQHRKLRLDNQLSYLFVNLPTSTEGAVPRLWDMRRRMEDFSSTIEGFAFFGFFRFCLILFPVSLVRRVLNFMLGKASCTVTFLTGPNTPLYFNGKMAKSMAFWDHKPNNSGLSLSIATYANHVRLGAVFHEDQPVNPRILLQEFQKEVENLAKHLSQRTLPSHLRWRARQQILMQSDDRESRSTDDPQV